MQENSGNYRKSIQESGSPIEIQILELFRQLSKERQREFLVLLRSMAAAQGQPSLNQPPASAREPTREKSIDTDMKEFLQLARDPAKRPQLLKRIQKLGLLESFLEAERGEKVMEL